LAFWKTHLKEIKMKKSTSAFAVAAALLFSTAAFAQQSATDSTPPNMKTTPDGVTPTPDSTAPSGKSSTHKKHSSKKHHKSGSSNSSGASNYGTDQSGSSNATSNQAPNMQTTPDGVTRTPDATAPATR
jgi:uncharacterized protein YraI